MSRIKFVLSGVEHEKSFFNLGARCLASKSYERYKQEVLAWMEETEASRSKQGILIALTLSNEETFKIRENV